MAIAVVAGATALCFAADDNQLGALVGLVLSVSWSVISVVLLASGSSERRIRAQMHESVVKDTLQYLLCEAKETPKREGDQDGDWAGLVDRISGLASTAIEGSARRN